LFTALLDGNNEKTKAAVDVLTCKSWTNWRLRYSPSFW